MEKPRTTSYFWLQKVARNAFSAKSKQTMSLDCTAKATQSSLVRARESCFSTTLVSAARLLWRSHRVTLGVHAGHCSIDAVSTAFYWNCIIFPMLNDQGVVVDHPVYMLQLSYYLQKCAIDCRRRQHCI